MPLRSLLAATASGLAAVLLVGCSNPDGTTQFEKVKAAIQSLGGTPGSIYLQEIVSKSPTTNQIMPQVLFLVFSKESQSFQLVDSQGDIFDDYDDFLQRNLLPG